MTRRLDVAKLDTIAFPNSPDDPAWLGAAVDSIELLKTTAAGDEILIYAVGSALLIKGVLAPIAQVTPADQEDLMHSFIQSDDTWCIQKSYGGGEGHRVYIEPPLHSPGCKSLAGGEMLVFRRSFYGMDEVRPELELSQKLVHCLALHWLADRSAFCRLDARGDVEEVIRVVTRHRDDDRKKIEAVTILAKDLATYMALSDMALMYRFDFTRFIPARFSEWSEGARDNFSSPDLFYHTGKGPLASFANGCMIVRPQITKEDLIEEWKEEFNPKKKEYAVFKILDRKNNKEVETSCAPDCISSYFEKNDLPWHISPAFFRPDVLHRFKADPQKYSLDDRTISCRNAWFLKTYDINEAGQVHTYIGYLADLPIEEQRYWQTFNEWPKGPISKRAHENDILGEFSSEYEPLDEIKRKIAFLNERKPAWWSFRSDKLVAAVLYPVADSTKEWGDEILAFDQLLVEGFLQKPLRAAAKLEGASIDDKWGSLKILQELAATKIGADEAAALAEPLRRLHALRTILRGHSSTTDSKKAEQDARREFGTLREQFKDLAAGCDRALVTLLPMLGIPETFA
ncbi:hypothetical protein CY658_12150 [Variovorax sp. RO1]|uniref:hypothetical protein n=1 Tax=Variovorax sp. RO1 TaxID=2066034 RepID=UPI000C71673E|nr:hypothetical protein [Variovorax sp. RO1]PLC04588.1 hypothetical protein CY658_12150 [Variovorax sp. RO1]